MSNVIEWEEKVETTRRMSLLAVHGSIGHGGASRPATLDDLRKACEAVGLVCETKDERANVIRIAGQDGFARGCDTYKARVTELETALNNAANGIGFGDAGPVVYALNARHDEREKEWESEREELVRTRQETQDKLSEARKELGELRANLRGCERWATDISKALSLYGPSQYDDTTGTYVGTGAQLVDGVRGIVRMREEMRARAEKAERDADAYAAERDALRKRCREAAQAGIARIGSTGGAENVESVVERLIAKLGEVEAERDALRARAEEAEKAYADKVLELKDEREESAGKSMRADAELSNLRAQVAASQPTAERATELLSDIQILAMADECYRMRVREDASLSEVRGLAMRVAARVRAERCLVTRAVELGKQFSVVSNDRGRWYVTVIGLGEENVAPADVPATLARMLGGGQ